MTQRPVSQRVGWAAMAPSGTPSTRLGNDVSADEDLPAQLAGTIEQVVGTVRDKTTRPALTIARGIVYGSFAAILSVVAVVLLIIGGVRLLDNYLPSTLFGDDHTWAAYMFLGLAFVIGGAILWRRRK